MGLLAKNASVFVLTLLLAACAQPAARDHAADPALRDRALQLWLGLPHTRTMCGAYDYFPDGGMRNFACHLGPPAAYATLVELAPLPVFLSGPHSRVALDLESQTDFGRYNPDFVRWLARVALPDARDSAFARATRPVWQGYVRPLAQIHRVTYDKWRANPRLLASETRRYLNMLEQGEVPAYDYERFFYFMNPGFAQNPDGGFTGFVDDGFDGGYNGNVVKTAAAFWLRRHVDGTAEIFYEALLRAFETYDAPDVD
jgi:hypothetical protein